MKFRKSVVVILTCASTLIGGTGLAAASDDSAASAPQSVTVLTGPAIVATSGYAQGQVSAADTITCTPQVQYPHKSTHVPGTVNVVVTLSCTKPVTRISIRAALYRNGNLVKDSGAKNVYGASFAQNNAAEPCHTATYTGWMSYFVNFPPGYTPPTGSSSGFGPSRPITC